MARFIVVKNLIEREIHYKHKVGKKFVSFLLVHELNDKNKVGNYNILHSTYSLIC